MKGFFIVFEGIEGCGKSTQARMLCRRLSREGLICLMTKEPGGTPLGNKLRSILKHGDSLSPEAELLLFNASRVQLVKEVIKPALEEGKIVILDRFYPSTMAYQGYGRGLGLDTIKTLNGIAMAEIKPDLIVLLDMQIEKGLSRKASPNRDRFEKECLDFHRRVREGYLIMAQKEPGRWFLVDATKDKKRVASVIYREVKRRLEAKK